MAFFKKVQAVVFRSALFAKNDYCAMYDVWYKAADKPTQKQGFLVLDVDVFQDFLNISVFARQTLLFLMVISIE